MTDQTPDPDQTPTDSTSSSADGESGWRGWLGKQDSHGRPMGVYLILAAGVVTLLALMLTIYLWSGDRGREEQPICTAITGDQAKAAILDAQVDQFTMVYSSNLVEMPENSGWGPVQARLDYSDGRCAYLPQGVGSQQALYAVLGVISFYNATTVNAQIDVEYSGLIDLDRGLFETPTAVPTETPPLTETPDSTPTTMPTETPPPTEIPASTPTTVLTETSTITPTSTNKTGTPAATPEAASTLTASPAGTPELIATPSPTP